MDLDPRPFLDTANRRGQPSRRRPFAAAGMRPVPEDDEDDYVEGLQEGSVPIAGAEIICATRAGRDLHQRHGAVRQLLVAQARTAARSGIREMRRNPPSSAH